MSNYNYSYMILDTNVYAKILIRLNTELIRKESLDSRKFIQSQIDSLRSAVGATKNVMFDTIRLELKKISSSLGVEEETVKKFFEVFNFIQPFFQFDKRKYSRYIKSPEKDELGEFKKGEKDCRRDQTILLTCFQYKIGNFVTFNHLDDDFKIYYERFYDDLYRGLKIYQPTKDFKKATLYPWVISERYHPMSLARKLIRFIESIYKS